jgi:hypothetical protein
MAALAEHLRVSPGDLGARILAGELAYSLGKAGEARLHFEMFLCASQTMAEAPVAYVIHCHTRLVEIAEEENDRYAEHLNRGLGLYVLAMHGCNNTAPPGEVTQAALLTRAAEELQLARACQPWQARPHYYLYLVWRQLGQGAAAVRSLRAADAQALVSHMTPKEQCDLQLAWVRELGQSGDQLPKR